MPAVARSVHARLRSSEAAQLAPNGRRRYLLEPFGNALLPSSGMSTPRVSRFVRMECAQPHDSQDARGKSEMGGTLSVRRQTGARMLGSEGQADCRVARSVDRPDCRACARRRRTREGSDGRWGSRATQRQTTSAECRSCLAGLLGNWHVPAFGRGGCRSRVNQSQKRSSPATSSARAQRVGRAKGHSPASTESLGPG